MLGDFVLEPWPRLCGEDLGTALLPRTLFIFHPLPQPPKVGTWGGRLALPASQTANVPEPSAPRSPASYTVSPFMLLSPFTRVPALASTPPYCAPPQSWDALSAFHPRAPPAPTQSWRSCQNRAGYSEPGDGPEPIRSPRLGDQKLRSDP